MMNEKRMLKRMVPSHNKFIERIRKSLYFGNDVVQTELEISRPLAEYSAELFSQAHRGHSLNRLHSVAAGSVHATPCSLLMALIYLDRLNITDPGFVRCITPQELFIVSMMISTKLHIGYDEQIYLSDWAKDGNVKEKHLKRLELDFLNAIEWNIYVSNEQFFEKLKHVEEQLARREGLKRGWLTYTELIQLLPSFTLAKFIFNHLVVIAISYTASLITIATSILLANQLTTTISNARPIAMLQQDLLLPAINPKCTNNQSQIIVDGDKELFNEVVDAKLSLSNANEMNNISAEDHHQQHVPENTHSPMDMIYELYEAMKLIDPNYNTMLKNNNTENWTGKKRDHYRENVESYCPTKCLIIQIFSDSLKNSFGSYARI